MIGENRQLVTDEPVEVQDCTKITDHYRGIYRIYPNLIKQNRRMSTCKWMDLQTLGSRPVNAQQFPRSLDWFAHTIVNSGFRSGVGHRVYV